jgi:hypothetical protein
MGGNQEPDDALGEVLREAKEKCGERWRSHINLNVC